MDAALGRIAAGLGLPEPVKGNRHGEYVWIYAQDVNGATIQVTVGTPVTSDLSRPVSVYARATAYREGQQPACWTRQYGAQVLFEKEGMTLQAEQQLGESIAEAWDGARQYADPARIIAFIEERERTHQALKDDLRSRGLWVD